MRLRDWLLERKAEAERGRASPFRGSRRRRPSRPSASRRRNDRAVRACGAARARRRSGAAQAASRALAESAPHARLRCLRICCNYHRREAKPEWWAYFERRKKSLDELMDDTEAIADLDAGGPTTSAPLARSLVYTLGFPPQEFKLAPDPEATLEDPFRQALRRHDRRGSTPQRGGSRPEARRETAATIRCPSASLPGATSGHAGAAESARPHRRRRDRRARLSAVATRSTPAPRLRRRSCRHPPTVRRRVSSGRRARRAEVVRPLESRRAAGARRGSWTTAICSSRDRPVGQDLDRRAVDRVAHRVGQARRRRGEQSQGHQQPARGSGERWLRREHVTFRGSEEG